VTTIRHALDVLKRFSAPAGILGEQWLGEQEKALRPDPTRNGRMILTRSERVFGRVAVIVRPQVS